MHLSLQRHPIEKVEAVCLIVPVFQERREDRLGLGELFDAGEVTGKPFEITLLHHVTGIRALRVLAIGMGKQDKFTAADLRRGVGAAVRYLRGRSISEASVWLEAPHEGVEFVSAAVEGAVLADWDADRYKTEKKESKALEKFSVAVGGGGPHLESAVERGRIIGEAQNFSRDLANEPPNLLTPAGAGGARARHGRGIRPGMRSAGPRPHGAAGHG